MARVLILLKAMLVVEEEEIGRVRMVVIVSGEVLEVGAKKREVMKEDLAGGAAMTNEGGAAMTIAGTVIEDNIDRIERGAILVEISALMVQKGEISMLEARTVAVDRVEISISMAPEVEDSTQMNQEVGSIPRVQENVILGLTAKMTEDLAQMTKGVITEERILGPTGKIIRILDQTTSVLQTILILVI